MFASGKTAMTPKRRERQMVQLPEQFVAIRAGADERNEEAAN